MLVVKHEAQIDWSRHRIESAEALDSYLREVMLPSLRDWITPNHPKSHYCKSLHLERMLANSAPHIDEARRIRQRKGNEAARQFLLGHINQHKKEHFDGWWCYLMKENPLYAQHPAFQYLVLRPVFESSTAKDTRTPLPLDAEALAHLFELIRKGQVAPETKLLRLLSEIMAFGATAAADEHRPSFGTNCRWVVIQNDDVNSANRVAALSHGSGWCVASSNMAAFYLPSSDFHLLLEGGRAKVALRLSENKAVEVQGHGNQDPGPWWPRILLYCAARGTQITSRQNDARQQAESIRCELAATQKTTMQFGDLLKAQPAKVHLLSITEELDDATRLVVQEAWLACLRADPLCGGMLPDWMEIDPSFKQASLELWVTQLSANPQCYDRTPRAFFQKPEIQAALKRGWIMLLKRDVTSWCECPEFLQQEFRQDLGFTYSLKSRWKEVLKRNVTRWHQCPEFLQQEAEVIRWRKTSWIELLKIDVTRWSECPELLMQDEEVMDAHKAGWMDLLNYNVTRWYECPDFLQQDEELIQLLKNTWIKILIKNPRKWRQCPDSIKQYGAVIEAFKTAWVNLLKADATQWKQRPRFLAKETQIIEATKNGWLRLLEKDPTMWERCPAFLQIDFQQDEGFLQNQVTQWIDLLGRDKDAWTNCPEFLKENTLVFQAYRNSWIQFLNNHNREWDKCPDILKDSEMHRMHREIWSGGIQMVDNKQRERFESGKAKLRGEASVTKLSRDYWINLLVESPQEWKNCPETLRADRKVVFALINGWLRLLEADPSQLANIPDTMQGNAQLLRAVKKGWAALHVSGSWRWKNCPQSLRSDDEFIEIKKEAWIQKLEIMAAPSRVVMLHKLLKEKVLVKEDLPSSWQSEKSVLSPILSPLEWVSRKPWIIDDRLEEIRLSIEEDGSEKRIREERLKYWKSEIKKDWRRWSITPASLRNDECLLVVMRKVLGPEIRRDPSLWNRLPECYRDDTCLQRVHDYSTRNSQGNC
jgi:hypothetical protein